VTNRRENSHSSFLFAESCVMGVFIELLLV